MPKCSLKGCNARKSEKHPELTLHRLPRNESMKKKWLDIIGIDNIIPKVKSVFICSLHFEESSFNRTLNTVQLQDNALPSRGLLIPSGAPSLSIKMEQHDSENSISAGDLDNGFPMLKDDSVTNRYPNTIENDEMPLSVIKKELDDEDSGSVREPALECIWIKQEYDNNTVQEDNFLIKKEVDRHEEETSRIEQESTINSASPQLRSIVRSRRPPAEDSGFLIKKEIEEYEVSIKEELDIGSTVLQPKTTANSYQPPVKVRDFAVDGEFQQDEDLIKHELDIGPTVLQHNTTTDPHQSSVEMQASARASSTPERSNLSDALDHTYTKSAPCDHTYAKTYVSFHHQDTTFAESLLTPGNDFMVFKMPMSNAENCRNYRSRKKNANKIKKVSVNKTNAERCRVYRQRKKMLAHRYESSANPFLCTSITSNSPMTFGSSQLPITTGSTIEESKISEESSNEMIVQGDVHHRHCSQLSASIATTNNVCVTETQAMSGLPLIDRGYPKTAAERMREYRARKNKENPRANHRKRKKSGAERAQEYRARKKAKIQSAANKIRNITDPNELRNLIEDQTIREQIQESENLVV